MLSEDDHILRNAFDVSHNALWKVVGNHLLKVA